MIRRFKCQETQQLFEEERSAKIPSTIQRVALRKLTMIDSALELRDLKAPPGNRLELLKGKRKGQHSIRINDQWRICFVWDNGGVLDVEIADYHD